MIRGMGFFLALSECEDDETRREGMSAALVVSRCAEDVFNRGWCSAEAFDLARQIVGRVDYLPLRAQLATILADCDPSRMRTEETLESLERALEEFGQYLHDAGELDPALEVFSLLWDVSHNDEIRLNAAFQRGFALRLLKRYDEAALAYTKLRRYAIELGDRRMELEADLGDAKLMIERGNLPAARRMLDEVIRASIKYRVREVAAKAHIDAARVAGISQRPAEVLTHCHLALPDVVGAANARRVMLNMATAFRELERAHVSEAIARYVATKSDNSEEQTEAWLLLYHLAIDVGDIAQCTRARTSLARAKLAPLQAVEYYEAVARDDADRGEFVVAITMARRALAVAEEYQIAEAMIRIDRALIELASGRVPTPHAFRPQRLTRKAEREIEPIETAMLDLCSHVTD